MSSSRAMLKTGTPSSRASSVTAESAPDPRSARSSPSTTPAMVAPAAAIRSTTPRTAVPAVITSSMISTLPASGAPISVPPSPWVLASLRLKAQGTSRPLSLLIATAVATASGMPL